MKSPAQKSIPASVSAAVARVLTPKGPRVSEAEAREVVAQLRMLAAVSAGEVHKITGLEAARHLTSEVRVVDRPAWIAAAAESFTQLSGEAFQKALAKSSSTAATIGSAASGVQMGAVLSLLSTKILGQFDPFAPGHPDGVLMLVAPTIEAVREELNVDAHDFSLWVCLHEQTHRVQFAAAPWLKGHLESRIRALTETLTSQAEDLSQELANLTRTLELVKRNKDAGVPVSELFMSPEARAQMSEITGIMSFLEGHANLVMDGVDASLIPSVKTIRRRFTERAQSRSRVEKAILRWMGMEKKAAQYRDGQIFCTRIVEARGMAALNRVFERPEHLPTEAEIHAPESWMARVLDGDVEASGSEAR